MILEAATAAAMYFSNSALAAESDVPVMVPQAVCKFKDPQKIRACLDAKFRDTHDPNQDMWDPNWISSITYKPEDVIPQNNDSAKAGAKMLPKSHTQKKQ